MNVRLCLCVGPEKDLRLVQGVPCHSPYGSRDRLQSPLDPDNDKRRWMNLCNSAKAMSDEYKKNLSHKNSVAHKEAFCLVWLSRARRLQMKRHVNGYAGFKQKKSYIPYICLGNDCC